MAHVEKYTRGSVQGLTIHWERKTENHSNKDIDNERSYLNYDLCKKKGDVLERMKERLDEVYCLNRKDVNVCASWVVTLPQTLADCSAEEKRLFFKKSYDFLGNRYGEKNILGGHVHNDETTPHMHFTFIPVTWDKKKEREKVSAKEVINRTDLKTFHTDLHDFLQREIPHIYKEGILNDKTIGIDTVQDLKKYSKEIQKQKDEMTKDLKIFIEPKKVLKKVQENKKEKREYVVAGEEIVQLPKKNYEQLEQLALSSIKLKNIADKMRDLDNEKVVALEKEVETLKRSNLKNKERNEFLRERNSHWLHENEDLRNNIEKHAESLKNARFSELEMENIELKKNLKREEDDYERLTVHYAELDAKKRELQEVLNHAVTDNERLYEEYNKLREGIEYFKWRFDVLWSVTKEFLRDYTRDGIETVKTWFEINTGEEIEPKPPKKKRQYENDLSL